MLYGVKKIDLFSCVFSFLDEGLIGISPFAFSSCTVIRRNLKETVL